MQTFLAWWAYCHPSLEWTCQMSTYQGVKVRVREIAKRRSDIKRDPGEPQGPELASQCCWASLPLEENQPKKKLPVLRKGEMESRRALRCCLKARHEWVWGRFIALLFLWKATFSLYLCRLAFQCPPRLYVGPCYPLHFDGHTLEFLPCLEHSLDVS